jgi:tripartite-type tricarboxylate transporter receptor subunit TctC
MIDGTYNGARVKAFIQIVFLCVFAGAMLLQPAAAEQFPTRPVRLVVPFSVGGGVDVLARALAERLSKLWGQNVIVDDRPGASTLIGGNIVVRSPPDGYTLFITSDATITSNPFLFKQLPFDPMTALVPVTQLMNQYQMVLANPSLKVDSLQDVVAFSKKNPNSLNYGSYGRGSPPSLLFEMLKTKTGAQITEVPFGGAAPTIAATLSDAVQMTLGGAAIAATYLTAGQLKALATDSNERLKSFPTVPTLAESGFAEIDPRTWFGLFAPAETPPEIVAEIQRDVASIIKQSDFEDRYIETVGSSAVGSTPEEFSVFIKNDLEYKRQLITLAHILPE